MKIFILFFLVCFCCKAETPTLHIEEGVSWKQVFDSGFRPKHFVGLESDRCVIDKQNFLVRFRDREQKFKVDDGRMVFDFYEGDFLRMIWHQGREAITLEEGEKKVAEFRQVFEGFIVQDMKIPAVIDPRGWVDAGNSGNNIEARIGEYVIWYGFDNSYARDRPIVPHFYIAWNFKGMSRPPSKKINDPVRPPVGYEWYSLDPKIDTPDPAAAASVKSAAHEKAETAEDLTRSETARSNKSQRDQSSKSQVWPWIAWGLLGLAVVFCGWQAWCRLKK